VADSGLLSLDNIAPLKRLVQERGHKLELILAVPAWRYDKLVETFRGLAFDGESLAEAAFAVHRDSVDGMDAPPPDGIDVRR
jgi:hypothetical protein